MSTVSRDKTYLFEDVRNARLPPDANLQRACEEIALAQKLDMDRRADAIHLLGVDSLAKSSHLIVVDNAGNARISSRYAHTTFAKVLFFLVSCGCAGAFWLMLPWMATFAAPAASAFIVFAALIVMVAASMRVTRREFLRECTRIAEGLEASRKAATPYRAAPQVRVETEAATEDVIDEVETPDPAARRL